MKKIILVLVLLVAVGASVAYYLFQKPVESLRSADPFKSFSSNELYEYFEGNEVNAGKELNGKVLKVKGKVVDLLANSDSSQTLILSSSHPVFGVKCRLDPDEAPKSIPGKGDQIQIKGLCTGMNSDVELNQCIILNK